MKILPNLLRLVLLGALVYIKFYREAWFALLGVDEWYINVAVVFFIFLLSMNLIIVLLTYFYRRSNDMLPNDYDNVTLGLNNLYYLILTAAIIFTIFGFLGVDLVTLFTSLSIVAAAIAIVAKEFISEIISGIILSFSQDISVGDYLKIGEHRGKIVDLKFTKVVFLNEDDDLVFIPNFTVFNSDIVNYTRNQTRRVTIEFEALLEVIKNIDELEKDLIDALHDFHEHIERNSFNLKIEAIYKDYVALKFQYILLESANRELEQEIRSATVRRVVDYVKSNYRRPLFG